MKNLLKEKLKDGKQAIGTFFELGGSTVVECLGISGLDFFIIDTEHGPFDVESSMEFIRTAELSSITPLVRIKDISRPSVLKMLDIGAKGLIVPSVETIDQVKNLIEWAKYYPLGRRGFFTARPAGYGYKDFARNLDSYFETCNEETLLIPQCETLGCLENIEIIVNMEGVDGIFIGPFDLSIAMGKPGKFDDSDFIQAIDRILAACRNAGKFSFIFATNEGTGKSYLNKGVDGLAINMDASILINGCKTIINNLR